MNKEEMEYPIEEELEEYMQLCKKLQQENKQLKNNWDKLKEYINLNYYDSYMYSSTIINKMQELEEKKTI